MDAMTQLYITMAGFVFFALMVTLYVLAGKDIIFAMRRRFQPRGADIFMLNPNRHVDRYYKIPDDQGNFKIKGKTYITNPDKVGSLGDKMKEKVELSETRRKKKLHKQIQKLQKKKDNIDDKLSALKKAGKLNDITKNQLEEIKVSLEDRMELLKSKLTTKEENYFMMRRSVYFYIENDPVPKDMFEYLSEFDIIQLDNVVARAQSKDRQSAQDMEEKLKRMQMYLLIAMGIAALAAWFAIKSSMGIEDIAKNLGVTLTI